MKVSPLDLRQLRFRTAFRGFDRAEVLALMSEVADDYEHALREVDRLQQEISKMEALLNQHREHERDLRDTMVTAQRVSDDIRTNAEAQARQIVREAEGRSDLLLQKTQARLEDIQREIDGMKMKRREVETTLEASVSALRSTLEFVREQEQREREERILLHRPRFDAAQGAPSFDIAQGVQPFDIAQGVPNASRGTSAGRADAPVSPTASNEIRRLGSGNA